jgi:hypothetical protein
MEVEALFDYSSRRLYGGVKLLLDIYKLLFRRRSN